MSYFRLSINPPENAESNGLIIVDEFHPRWKEAARAIMGNNRIEREMKDYESRVAHWDPTVSFFQMEFDKDLGLYKVATPWGQGVLLHEKEEKYESHRIKHRSDILYIATLLNNYLNWLREASETLPE